jgi:cell wall assembly regulator SMI1
MHSMKELWQYIKKSQPELKTHLLPGASLEEIQNIEDSLNIEFPISFKECYLIHNGLAQSRFIDYWRLFPLKEIVEIWTYCKKLCVFDDLNNEYNWNPRWIPFGSNMGGNIICLNLDPVTEDTENVPEGFSRFGELFIYFQDEKRVTSQNIEFHEWFENFLGTFEETD